MNRVRTPQPPTPAVGEPAVLDTALGLANIGHRPRAYAAVLRLFADQHRDDASRLRQLLGAGERAPLGRLAHALRGAAGSIGALRLAAAAGRLESACRNGGDPLDERVTAVATALQVAVAAMQAHPTPSADDSPNDRPDRPAAQWLDELRTLLQHGDMAALDLIAQQRTVLHRLLGPRLAALEAHVRRFDHEAALRLLPRD